MESALATIKKYYNACRPDEPIAPTDPRWVNLAPLRGSGLDIVSRILREIELEENFVTFLVTGFRGTGKTSLLKDCQQQLTDSGYHVVYTDVEADYLVNPYEPINANDVLLTSALALVDQGLGPGYLKRLWGDIRSLATTQVIPDEMEVEALPITSDVVRQVIDRSVSLSAELPLETYRADLEAILVNAEHRLPRDDEKLRRMYQMIRDHVILRYSNRDQWEGIHPLVMAHIKRELFDHLVFPPRT